MKKLFSAFLSLVLVLSLLPPLAPAARAEERGAGEGYSYRFGVFSDVHVTMHDGEEDMKRAIEFYEREDVDFILLMGDLQADGTLSELRQYKSAVEDSALTVPMYVIRGNHDSQFTDEEWRTYVGNDANMSFSKGSDLFVMLSLDTQSSHRNCHYDGAEEYLKETLAAHPEAERVFVGMHYPIYGHAGLAEGEADGFSASDQQQFNIYNAFDGDYFIFSGHTHYDFTIPTIDYDTRGRTTTVHVPSCAYPEDEDHHALPDRSQGYVVDVYDDGVQLRGVDFSTGRYLNAYSFYVPNGGGDAEGGGEMGSSELKFGDWSQADHDDATGLPEKNHSSMCTGYIELEPGSTYTVDLPDGTNSSRLYFWDSSGTFTRRSDRLETHPEERTFTASESEAVLLIKTNVGQADDPEAYKGIKLILEDEPRKACEGLEVSRSSAHIGDDLSLSALTASVRPQDTNDPVVWRSSDPFTAECFAGYIRPAKTGSCTIYVQCGDKTAQVQVTLGGEAPEEPPAGGGAAPGEPTTQTVTGPDGTVGVVSRDGYGVVTEARITVPASAKGRVTAPVELTAYTEAGKAPDIVVTAEGGEAEIELPVGNFGPGVVAAVMDSTGEWKAVRDCAAGDRGVVLKVEGTVTLRILDLGASFSDMAGYGWAVDPVKFVTARGLFSGTGGGRFQPATPMTRGMLATVLYRAAYEPEAGENVFWDVEPGKYYSDAVAWAYEAGVVTGYAGGAFGPDDNVTREQMVAMLYRFAKLRGAGPAEGSYLASFSDAGSVSAYAMEAMNWAVAEGIVNGVGGSRLAPGAYATRAEMAAVVMRLIDG